MLATALVVVCCAANLTVGTGVDISRQPADTIRLEVGSPEVDGLVYKPHAARVRVHVDSILTAEWTNVLTFGDSAGRRVARWVTSGVHYGTGRPVEWTIRQTYDARTMAPLGYDMRSGDGGFTQLRIDGVRVQGTRRTLADVAARTVDLTLDRAGFIASASDLVPMAVGLKRGSVMIAPVWGPSMTKSEYRIFSVLDEVLVNVEGADVRAWKVEERRHSDGRVMATWYLTNQSPYMVYGEVPLANGRTQRMSEVEIPMPRDP